MCGPVMGNKLTDHKKSSSFQTLICIHSANNSHFVPSITLFLIMTGECNLIWNQERWSYPNGDTDPAQSRTQVPIPECKFISSFQYKWL